MKSIDAPPVPASMMAARRGMPWPRAERPRTERPRTDRPRAEMARTDRPRAEMPAPSLEAADR